MRLVTYNIQFTRGKDGRHDSRRIANEVRGADVIALQEVDRYWDRSGNTDQATDIAGALQDYHWVYGPGVDLALDYRDADGVLQNRRRQFGNMLLSRTPILYTRNHLLPKYGSLGPISVQRSALEGVIECRIGNLRVYSVHLTHLSAQTRLPQVDALLSVYSDAPRQGPPLMGEFSDDYWDHPKTGQTVSRNAVLLGDFNFQPESEEYTRIVGPLSPYGGRVVNPEGLVDAWVANGGSEEAGVTADVKANPARLDYCFVSSGLLERIKDVKVDHMAQGSDHQPLWAELDL